MENQVTPIDKTPEQIQCDMAITRESLTGKVAALENQVVGSVQTAADTLTDTVAAVKSFVSTAPDTVSDSVKQAACAVSDKMKEVFDVSSHVAANPWASVGISAGLGFLAGLTIFRRESPLIAPLAAAPTTATSPARETSPQEPGMFDELFTMLGGRLREMAQTALDSASTAVNQCLRDSVPKLVDSAAERLTPETQSPRFGGVGRVRA